MEETPPDQTVQTLLQISDQLTLLQGTLNQTAAHGQQVHNYAVLITIMLQLVLGFWLGYKLGER